MRIVMIQVAAERKVFDFAPSIPALCILCVTEELCGPRMIWKLWISSMNGQSCYPTKNTYFFVRSGI